MNTISLRQLIRESINEYIREIDHAGETAAVEAKIAKIGEAIALREKKMNMEGIDEAYHDMLDKGKMKELGSEIKTLKKSLAKYEKQLEKLKSKGEKVAKAEEVEEKEIVDEVSVDGALDEMAKDPESGPQLEEENIDIYEMLYMQKRAGIISEREYNEKIEEAKFEDEMLNEIYSEKDMRRGEEIDKSSFGMDIKFPKDFRKDKLIIKKLVRLKSKIDNEELKSEIDNILDMLENTDK